MGQRLALSMALGAVLTLSGCMDAPVLSGLSDVKPVAFVRDKVGAIGTGTADVDPDAPALTAAADGTGSEVIADLISRRSVLEPGSNYATLASALLDTSSGVAQAELRAAKMRAVARDKNWLPTIGPSISLNSLGELAAGLILDQVIYDNGKRKAERAFAAADVEVSAVALTQDANDRVYEGLMLLVTASEANAKAEMAERGLGRMREFNRVVTERVRGGVSSLSDQRVVRTKITTMEQEVATHREARDAAEAELRSMAGGYDVSRMSQAVGLRLPSSDLEPLTVIRAQAEAKRTRAEAEVERAGLLPSLSASTILGQKDSSDITYGGAATLGLGTSAEMAASTARADAADAAVQRAREEAERTRARFESRLAALTRQERDVAEIAQQSRANYRLFQDQFDAGKKTVMDVLSVYEQMVRDELQHIDIKYEIVLTQLEAARLAGALANGVEI
ncbi:TolC family protein [Celeribacter sp.]|uniref:TolC family protein n=1 Tax=Celeribacter sp. TaxID=1890673 RepID=UPI003A91E0CA